MIFKENHALVIFNDHQLYTHAFSALIERLNVCKAVYAFSNEKALLQFFTDSLDDTTTLLLIDRDHFSPGKNLSSICKEIKNIKKSTQIILASSVIDPIGIGDWLRCWPHGLLSKSSEPEDVLNCFRAIARGKQYISEDIREILEKKPVSSISFTARELELLQYFAKGYNIKTTAGILYVSPHTIVTHRRTMMRKTNTHSIGALLAYARSLNLV